VKKRHVGYGIFEFLCFCLVKKYKTMERHAVLRGGEEEATLQIETKAVMDELKQWRNHR
jgi:hypothetical protein